MENFLPPESADRRDACRPNGGLGRATGYRHPNHSTMNSVATIDHHHLAMDHGGEIAAQK